jgi:hypothetical protein
VEEFIRDYELQSKPVIIYNAMNSWTANKNWTIEALTKKYAEVKVRTVDMILALGDLEDVIRHVSNCRKSCPSNENFLTLRRCY